MQTAQLTAACTSNGKRRGNRTSEDLEAKIRELADLPRPDLTERWRQLCRAAPPKGISRPLLIRAVAYGMQVKRYGGLKPAVRRQLRKVVDGGPAQAAANLRTAKIAPGMRLIREWNGSSHLVEALLQGLAGVDRAAQAFHRASSDSSPKKRGPDQRAPVMARATAESEP